MSRCVPWPWRVESVARAAVLLLAAVVLSAAARADEQYDGRSFRATGHWTGQELRAEAIRLRDADDADRGQIAGRLTALDARTGHFRIGPVRVAWTSETRFERLAPTALADGLPVRVSGRLEQGFLRATSIRPTEDAGPGALQVTGTAIDVVEHADGTRSMYLLTVPVHMLRAGYNAVESLTRRQGSRRAEPAASQTLFGRPLRVSGEYSFELRDRGNRDLQDSGSEVDLESELELEAFYAWSDRLYLFAGIQGSYQAELTTPGGRAPAVFRLERDQTWIFADRLFGSGFGLQIGRQNFKETREWWWDDDLDAVRVYYDRGPLHAELGLAQELAALSTDDDGIDPERRGVRRWLGTASWLWAPRHRLEAFLLDATDRSPTETVGTRIDTDREDDVDADLAWMGLRAIGEWRFDEAGVLAYWVDVARVSGRETRLDFEDLGDASRVAALTSVRVRGSAFDLGLTWEPPLRWSPAVTAGLARGSGDRDPADGIDQGFRQTGLHANKWRFAGVNRFHFYGEVLRPDLTNLEIATLSLGWPLLANSSLELSWHRYRLLEPDSAIGETRIRAPLDGRGSDLGQELDLVIGFREGRRLDLALTAGAFLAGDAYGDRAGELALLLLLEASWNF